MRRDTIFYKLFRQFPSLLFDLLDNPPANAATYRFDSVAVKEPRFEIDGVFLPSLSRQEIDAMLGITLQETRVYQEAKAEGEEIGQVLGEQKGRLAGQRSLLLLLLNQKFDRLPQMLSDAVSLLSLAQLETLALRLLNFQAVADLETWLRDAVGDRLLQHLTERSGELPAELQQRIKTLELERLIALNQALPEAKLERETDGGDALALDLLKLDALEAIATWLDQACESV